MPSQRTRAAYDRIVLATAGEAIAQASDALSSATADLTAVQGTLSDIADGTLDLDAITVGGTQFVNDGAGNLVAVP